MSVIPSPWQSEGEEVSDVVLVDDDDSASRLASSAEPSPRLGGEMLTKDAPSSSHTRDDSDAGVDPDCSNDQEVLEEAGSDYEPTYEETVAYARWLGIKPHEDIRMMRIAKEGLRAKLPPDWKPCRTGDGQVYYFNFTTGESDWDHPCDGIYRAKVEAERIRETEAPSPSSASEAFTDALSPSVAPDAKADEAPHTHGSDGNDSSVNNDRSARSSGSFAHATPKPPGVRRMGKQTPSPRIVGGALRKSPDSVALDHHTGTRSRGKRRSPRHAAAVAAARDGAIETTVLRLEDFSLVESFHRSGTTSSDRFETPAGGEASGDASGASLEASRKPEVKPLNLAGIGGGEGTGKKGGNGMFLTAEAFGLSGTFDSTLDDSRMSDASDFLPRDDTADKPHSAMDNKRGGKKKTPPVSPRGTGKPPLSPRNNMRSPKAESVAKAAKKAAANVPALDDEEEEEDDETTGEATRSRAMTMLLVSPTHGTDDENDDPNRSLGRRQRLAPRQKPAATLRRPKSILEAPSDADEEDTPAERVPSAADGLGLRAQIEALRAEFVASRTAHAEEIKRLTERTDAHGADVVAAVKATARQTADDIGASIGKGERDRAADFARVESTLRAMAERTERAAEAAVNAERAVDRALEKFVAEKIAAAVALPAPAADYSARVSMPPPAVADAGGESPTPVKFIKSANGDWKPKNRDWKPKPLPTLPNMNFDAETESGEFDETRAARLVKMMEESPEIENPTFVSSIRAVIGALVR